MVAVSLMKSQLVWLVYRGKRTTVATAVAVPDSWGGVIHQVEAPVAAFRQGGGRVYNRELADAAIGWGGGRCTNLRDA